jgi:hypothetical protein
LAPLVAEIQSVLQQNISLSSFYDCIQAYLCHAKPVPTGMKKIQID